MTNEKIKRMCELQAIIDSATKDLENLKIEARAEANGESLTMTAENGKYVVVVARPGKATESLDTKAFRTKAPKQYEQWLAKYKKVSSPKAARVTPSIAK